MSASAFRGLVASHPGLDLVAPGADRSLGDGDVAVEQRGHVLRVEVALRSFSCVLSWMPKGATGKGVG